MMRGRLLKLWREARRDHGPVDAWASIVENRPRPPYKSSAAWAASCARAGTRSTRSSPRQRLHHQDHGPDRIIGFSPIPAMSMVSYAAGARYLSLIGGVCLSFYDWYCDLPPAARSLGRADRRAGIGRLVQLNYIIAWGSNVPQTRTPDAHFFTEVRYKGTKTVASPRLPEVAKLADLWLHPKQGTDARWPWPWAT
jgi:nitrate reductase alpha subunit